MTDIVERLGDFGEHALSHPLARVMQRAPMLIEAADTITALRAENARLRQSWADLGNRINVVGSHYEMAVGSLDNMVRSVKTQARAALKGEANG